MRVGALDRDELALVGAGVRDEVVVGTGGGGGHRDSSVVVSACQAAAARTSSACSGVVVARPASQWRENSLRGPEQQGLEQVGREVGQLGVAGEPLADRREERAVATAQHVGGGGQHLGLADGEDEPRDVRVLPHPAQVVADQRLDSGARVVVRPQRGQEAGLVAGQAVDVELGGDPVLAPEVVVDAADAGSGGAADVLHRRRGVALPHETVQCSVEDCGAPGLPRRSGGGGGRGHWNDILEDRSNMFARRRSCANSAAGRSGSAGYPTSERARPAGPLAALVGAHRGSSDRRE